MSKPLARPKFSDVLLAFCRVHGTGLLSDVANTIGGHVKQNVDAQIFKNACALRLSYALQYGSTISVPQETH